MLVRAVERIGHDAPAHGWLSPFGLEVFETDPIDVARRDLEVVPASQLRAAQDHARELRGSVDAVIETMKRHARGVRGEPN